MRLNLARILANAIARRVAFVLVALVLAWVGLGDARAQNTNNADQGAAYAACNSAHAAGMASQSSSYVVQAGNGCVTSPPPYYYSCSFQRRNVNCPTCNFTNISCGLHYYPMGSACQNRPGETFTHADRLPSGSHGCKSGCGFVVNNNGDGTYTRGFTNYVCDVLPDCAPGEYLHVGSSLCMAPEQECDAGQTKNANTGACEDTCPAGMKQDESGLCKPIGDTCPPGNIKSPDGQCLPGEGQCAAGEARRDNGTCGKDSDGDGQADEDDEDEENDPDKETASGGDSCNAPPSCSGSAIMCMQVKIQWRIDCNTRSKADVTGGSCAAIPVCTGDGCRAVEYAQLLQQWRTACAIEKLNSGGGPGGGGTDEADDYMSATRSQDKADLEASANEGDGHADIDPDAMWHQNEGVDFNPNLFGATAPGSCAFTSDLKIMGHQIEVPPALWIVLQGVGWLIVALAYIRALSIVAS